MELNTRSAERAYALWLEDHKKGYNYTNKRLIEFLDITDDEQMGLKTIIGHDEKMRRMKEKNWYNDRRDAEKAWGHDKRDVTLKQTTAQKRAARDAEIITLAAAGKSHRQGRMRRR